MRQKRGRLVGVARCGDSEMTLVEKGIGMAHKLALALALIIMCANIAGAQQQKPLHLVKPSAWADMTEREKELYVTGVLKTLCCWVKLVIRPPGGWREHSVSFARNIAARDEQSQVSHTQRN